MSRVGKYPVLLPQGVTCTFENQAIHVKGPKGESVLPIPLVVTSEIKEGKIFFSPAEKTSHARSLWGTTRNLVRNAVKGVSEGTTIVLELVGVGYRAAVQGKILKLQLGYSHDIEFSIPEGMQIKCEKPTQISIWGTDCQKVGQVAADIRRMRKSDPYKGKGIHSAGQFIFRKEGKKK